MCGGEKYFFCHSIFHLSAQKAEVALDLSRSFSSSSAAGTKECFDVSSRCCIIGVNRSRSWRRCSGSIARRARENVALFRRSSVGVIPARTKRLSIEVGRRHPATNHKVSCMGLSSRRVCLLLNQTETQYSAAELLRD